jgi:hypothetical protein
MLHREAVEPHTLELLTNLSKLKTLEGFVLVGGTALALQIGHRKSVDLDFFSKEEFDARELLDKLSKDFRITPVNIDNNTLIASVVDVKVDFIRFRYPFKKPFLVEDNISMLRIGDIAPMKIDAITGRGHKKDFFDLFYLLKYMSLGEILDSYRDMFGHDTIFHVLKSLVYFEDAENNPEPVLLDKNVTWKMVKEYLVNVVNAYMNEL